MPLQVHHALLPRKQNHISVRNAVTSAHTVMTVSSQVAKCDGCGRKGKLKQNLPLLGEVKHFCAINCLLKFCCDQVATQGEIPKGMEKY